MAVEEFTISRTLAGLKKVSSKEAAEFIQTDLNQYPFAAALAEMVLKFGDPQALWLARWNEGELAGELGLLADVARDRFDPPGYFQFRLDFGRPRTGLLHVVYDPLNALLTEGIWRYKNPYPILISYKSIDEQTPDNQTKGGLIKITESTRVPWHISVTLDFARRNAQLGG